MSGVGLGLLKLALSLGCMLPIAASSQSVAPAAAHRRPSPGLAGDAARGAADTSRTAALQALAARLHLPLVDQAVAIFSTQLRSTLPAYVVAEAGRNLQLGSQWKPGAPSFDEAVRQVDLALAHEEVRGGPLLKLERGDLLLIVNVPWTRDDIEFVDATLGTPLGQEAERALDAQAARQTIATLRRRVELGTPGEAIRRSFAELDATAASQYADASLTLLAMNGADPARVQRLRRLVEAVTLAPSDALGARIVERLSRRLLDAATAQLPAIVTGLTTQ